MYEMYAESFSVFPAFIQPSNADLDFRVTGWLPENPLPPM